MQYNIAHLTWTVESYAEERAGLSFMKGGFCLDTAVVTVIQVPHLYSVP